MNKISQLFRDMVQGAVIKTPGLKAYWQTSSRAAKRQWLFFLGQSLMTGLIGGIMLGFYHQQYPPLKVATVDIVKLSKSLVKRLAALSLNEKASQETLQDAVAELENTLKTFALDHHCLILPKEAVIEGAMDITEFVEPLIEKSDE